MWKWIAEFNTIYVFWWKEESRKAGFTRQWADSVESECGCNEVSSCIRGFQLHSGVSLETLVYMHSSRHTHMHTHTHTQTHAHTHTPTHTHTHTHTHVHAHKTAHWRQRAHVEWGWYANQADQQERLNLCIFTGQATSQAVHKGQLRLLKEQTTKWE